MQAREVLPEILDKLDPDDPRAVSNRRDLRRINALMGNWRWVARQLRSVVRPGMRVLEAGAGDGEMGRWLLRKIPVLGAASYIGLDRVGRPKDWPADSHWAQADLLEYDFSVPPDILAINLLLHQFEDEDLLRLGKRIAEIPIWIFCEPLRSPVGICGLALLRPFGLCDVSWHDGRVSVRAGFRGNELSQLLSQSDDCRERRITTDFRGAYRMVSCRR